MVNKYLLVCHVGSGPFPQKQSFPHACIKAMCCHGNASSKASDGLIFFSVDQFLPLWRRHVCMSIFAIATSFSLFSGTLKSFGCKRAEYFTDRSISQTVIGQPRSLTPIP